MSEQLRPPFSGEPGAWAVDAPAKLNLFLEVLGRRPDGYHGLETVMVAVDWADRLTFRRTHEAGVRLRCTDGSLPTDERNLVVRAARRLLDGRSVSGGVEIGLDKQLPHGAGMGGGSSDAAATLTAINGLFGLGLGPDALAAAAAELGSDVPFFLTGGGAVCRGRGEIREPFPAPVGWAFVVVAPEFALSTAEVYRSLRLGDGAPSRAGGSADVVRALADRDPDALGRALFNRLEEPALRLAPRLAEIRTAIRQAGAVAALMTGSGSAVFGVCRDREHAGNVAETLRSQTGVGRVRIVHTLPVGT